MGVDVSRDEGGEDGYRTKGKYGFRANVKDSSRNNGEERQGRW